MSLFYSFVYSYPSSVTNRGALSRLLLLSADISASSCIRDFLFMKLVRVVRLLSQVRSFPRRLNHQQTDFYISIYSLANFSVIGGVVDLDSFTFVENRG